MRHFLLSLLVLCLSLQPAAARDTFVNHLEAYIIEREIIEAPNCRDAEGVPEDARIFNDITLVPFERGVCEFHQPARSPEQTQRAISFLDQAQIQGLPPVHQQLAGLLTGLAQCARAETALEVYRASAQQDSQAKMNFCAARRRAAAELNGIRWDAAMFDYSEGLPAHQSLDARLTEMSACYAGVLSPGLDAECGLITNLTTTEIEAFAEEATVEVITTFFTGVESPVTAMFQRKTSRAEGVQERATGAIEGLKTRAAGVNAEFDAYDETFEAARDTVMAPIYDAYREAILQASAILDEFERWKGGLFIKSDGTNMLPLIGQRSEAISEELTRVTDNNYLARTDNVIAAVRSVLDQEREIRQMTGSLCRIYYCELINQQNIRTATRICRKAELDDNPLCLNQAHEIRSGVLEVEFGGPQSITVTELCRASGLDDVFLQPGLAPAAATLCQAELP